MFNAMLTDELNAKSILTITKEYAWKYNDALEVVLQLGNGGYAILGGDVLTSDLGYTYDNWCYTYNHSISLECNMSESASVAVKYIDWYNGKYGDGFYYVLVSTTKADYVQMQSPAIRD